MRFQIAESVEPRKMHGRETFLAPLKLVCVLDEHDYLTVQRSACTQDPQISLLE